MTTSPSPRSRTSGRLLRGSGIWAVLLLVSCRNAAAERAELEFARSPYLQAVTETTITIRWHSGSERTGVIEYGETEVEEHRITEDSPRRDHRFLLENLRPGTVYRYRASHLDAEGQPVATTVEHTFRTAPGNSTDSVTAWVIGDSGAGSDDQLAIRDLLLEHDFSLFLHSGDVVYPRMHPELVETRFFEVYAEILARSCFYPTLGNHDLEAVIEDGQLFQRRDLFLEQFELPGLPREDGGIYYSIDHGPIHLAVLDSVQIIQQLEQPGSPVPQRDWLFRDLEASERPWKIVMFHHPPYSGGHHGPHLGLRRRFGPIFELGGADLVISGHEHLYQRSLPIIGEEAVDGWQGDDLVSPRGPVYVVTGGGGARLYDLENEDELRRMARWVVRHHALEIVADGESLAVRAHDREGAILDEFTIRRGPRPRPAFIRGDVDASGVLTIGDPVHLLGHTFLGSAVACPGAGDWDRSGWLDVTDAVNSLAYQFLGAEPPPEPFPGCGPDPDLDLRGCRRTACPPVPAGPEPDGNDG